MVIEVIGSYLADKLRGQDEFDYEKLAGGDCAIEFSYRYVDWKQRNRRDRYHISISNGFAVLAVNDIPIGWYDFSDPAFPDNLLQSLPVLHLPNDDGLPQDGVAIQK